MTGRGRPPATAVAALAGWTVALVITVVALHAIGGALAPPPLTGPAGWGDWLAARQPAEAAVALVRLVVLGLAWYLLVATVAGTLARALGAARLVRATDAVSVPLVRRLVRGVAGLSLATTAFTGTGATAWAHDGSAQAAAAVETMRRLPDEAAAATGGPPPTMRRLADDAGAQAPTAAEEAAPAAVPAPAPAPAPAGERTWTVRPGQHFWAVAEGVLAEAWGRQPADAEVDDYWRALVAANRAVLADPDNPDLLFPGQIIAVPAPPAAP